MKPKKHLLTTFSVLLIAALLVACVSPPAAPVSPSAQPTATSIPPTPVPPTPEPTPVAAGAGYCRCAGAIAAARGVTS